MTPDEEMAACRLLPRLWQAGDHDAINGLLSRDALPLPELQAARALMGADDVAARCGVLGFSFPCWRFLSQGVGGTSLLEQAGMVRLTRTTDVRDATLPDPARDEFGVGFCVERDGFYIEYRRAYLLCARLSGSGAGGLIIRNNSYFFGRDRLPWPAAYAPGLRSAKEWQGLSLDGLGMFGGLTSEDLGRAEALALQEFDGWLNAWLLSAGREPLVAFLQRKLEQGRGMPYAGWVKTGEPPWRPVDVVPVDAALIEVLADCKRFSSRSGYRFTLLSGPSGDLPLV